MQLTPYKEQAPLLIAVTTNFLPVILALKSTLMETNPLANLSWTRN